MDDHGCPRCKTTKYRNPSLKLMVNVCGHTLCENCVEMLFVRGSGNCVQCDTPLRKSNFRVQLFEDPTVDKEVEIRKKVLKIYNKRDVDFPSLREYNDYLEQVEDIVFNLTNNIDVENTKLQMEEYQRENRDVIQRNKAKLTREQEELEELLLLEQRDNEQRRLEVLQEEQRQLQAKRKNKQALLDELEQSKLPATLLLAQHKVRAAQLETQIEQQKQVVKPTNLFSTGIHMRQTVSLQPVPKIEEVLYHYKPLRIEICGPQVPELEQLGRLGFSDPHRAHIHLMGLSGLEGPEGEGSEVADPGGAEVQDQNGAELSSGSSGDERCSLYQVASGLSGLCDASPSPTAAAVRREGSCPACQPASTASNRYLNHVRAAMPQDTAGGYTSALACHRAIQDAFSGLFPPKG